MQWIEPQQQQQQQQQQRQQKKMLRIEKRFINKKIWIEWEISFHIKYENFKFKFNNLITWI